MSFHNRVSADYNYILSGLVARRFLIFTFGLAGTVPSDTRSRAVLVFVILNERKRDWI